MSETLRRESPLVWHNLAARATSRVRGAGVQMSERPFLGHVNLRGKAGDAAFAKAVKSVVKVDLPTEPNTVAETKGVTVLWLGPDEWLLVTEKDAQAELIAKLTQAVAGLFAAVTDVSANQTVIVLAGPDARTLLAKGCPLDLHPRAFKPGQCAQTVVAKSPALIRPLAEGRYVLIVRRSFADYLWGWLEGQAAPHGVVVTES